MLMSLSATATEILSVKGYPYWRPESSFIYLDGKYLEFEDSAWAGADKLADLEVTDPLDNKRRR